MNYRHEFHAGSFTDVFKHIVLVALLEFFKKKENPFFYFETHAGNGKYDLASSEAQKSKEFLNGIAKLFSEKNAPPLIESYLAIIRKLNRLGTLRFYPGSPYFAKQLLREHDRMLLCELQPQVFADLKKLFARTENISVKRQDGYASLKEFLPPKERRGFVLIDPPYEKPDELNSILSHLEEALERWETGTFVVWYPIKNRHPVDAFLRKVQAKIKRETLVTEFSIYPSDIQTHLSGNGMLIINPPWQLDQKLQETLPWLLSRLNQAKGRFEIKFLVK